MKQVTAVLIGAGARGQVYARYAQEHPEELLARPRLADAARAPMTHGSSI